MKTFDCVELKRQGAEQVRRQIEGKTFDEQIEFWRKGTEELIKLQRKLRNKGKI